MTNSTSAERPEYVRARAGRIPPGSTAQITHDEMTTAVTAGDARYLSETIKQFAVYQSTWWMSDRDGWFKITDGAVLVGLETASSRMAVADRTVRQESG
ncbi:hypothetical protein [Streptomyces sp. CBMA29]|uniref:hypothetical protein n=1 Tax=Streptomyces sp. CBMA29 TaxID=1896314 RepID=UPI00166214CE|nr:hypothetical protein [Streptomyces sp. CBMA29]MBD0737826.1 hypothetical protein [Streptomyces sp. CBMA29]